ncbi:MAG: hypothetical protein RMX68_029145 [Aulosira sp. ZfuVER01]|nr:hypothetical protein [Aulosira sp. ZfuVER01]MDZ8002150.1 hypothetical protein [Aulosira sp. DedVER01a]MDZ8052583.1 hypothetical protein [Aulosira sp. ZfuCHP01]
MIFQDYEPISHVNELLRKIRVKENQLKIAQKSNMAYTAQSIENQILELRHKLSESQDHEVQALMSLLDD